VNSGIYRLHRKKEKQTREKPPIFEEKSSSRV